MNVARQFMRSNGNQTQWINGYPSEELIIESILKKENFVCESAGEIVGTFCFSTLPDPTYAIITEGAWLNEAQYGVIHRLASNGKTKGIAEACIQWCFEQINNIKVDTHIDNIPMQRIFEKYEFQKCGIIYLSNGDARIAFQKTI